MISQDQAYVELNNSYGSFNTWKNTLKAGTGFIAGSLYFRRKAFPDQQRWIY